MQLSPLFLYCFGVSLLSFHFPKNVLFPIFPALKFSTQTLQIFSVIQTFIFIESFYSCNSLYKNKNMLQLSKHSHVQSGTFQSRGESCPGLVCLFVLCYCFIFIEEQESQRNEIGFFPVLYSFKIIPLTLSLVICPNVLVGFCGNCFSTVILLMGMSELLLPPTSQPHPHLPYVKGFLEISTYSGTRLEWMTPSDPEDFIHFRFYIPWRMT